MKALAIIFFACLAACELPVNGTGPIPENPPPAPASAESDAGSPKPPPNGDQAQATICHSFSALGSGTLAAAPTRAQCPTGYAGYDVGGPYFFVGCQGREAPVECSTCDYTCDCLLRYTELPDAGCTCSQSATGGVIIISGC